MILHHSMAFQYFVKIVLYEVTVNVVIARNVRYERGAKLSFPGGHHEDKSFNQYIKVSFKNWF